MRNALLLLSFLVLWFACSTPPTIQGLAIEETESASGDESSVATAEEPAALTLEPSSNNPTNRAYLGTGSTYQTRTFTSAP